MLPTVCRENSQTGSPSAGLTRAIRTETGRSGSSRIASRMLRRGSPAIGFSAATFVAIASGRSDRSPQSSHIPFSAMSNIRFASTGPISACSAGSMSERSSIWAAISQFRALAAATKLSIIPCGVS